MGGSYPDIRAATGFWIGHGTGLSCSLAALSKPFLQETWTAMEECVDKGLVRSIGVSNFSPEKIEAFFADAKIFPAVNQVC